MRSSSLAPFLIAALVLSLLYPSAAGAQDEEPAKTYKLELSFGATLLFVEQPLLTGVGVPANQRILPTPGVLILAEYLVHPRWSLAMFGNIPIDPVRKIDTDGNITEDYLAAAIAVGGAYTPLRFTVLEDTVFAVQTGALLGHTIRATTGDRAFPLIVLRLHLSTPTGFTMYTGTAFSFQRDTVALIYGVGQRF